MKATVKKVYLSTAALVLIAAGGCADKTPIAEGSLDLNLADIDPAAATVQATAIGPESRTISQATNGSDRRQLRFELLRPGRYEVEVSSLFSASRVLQQVRVESVTLTAGQRSVVEAVLLPVEITDAGVTDANPSVDAALADVQAAEAATDAGFEDAGEDAGSSDASEGDAALIARQPQGVMAPGFPVVFNGSGDDLDRGHGVARDGDDVWVVGSSVGLELVARMALWRFDRHGALAAGFPKIPDNAAGGSGGDVGIAVAVDRDGSVWVTGASSGADGSEDLVLWRYDRDGNLASGFPVVRAGDAGGSAQDRGSAVAIDVDGNVWVAGVSANAAGNLDMAVWKFASDGTLAQGFPLLRDGDAGGQGNDRGLAIEVAADGRVWVAGSSTAIGGDRDLALWRFSLDGVLDPGFPHTWDGGLHDCDEGTALVVTEATVRVAGRVCVGDGTTDMAIWAFDRGGLLQPGSPWRWDGPGGQFDELTGLAVDPAGGLWAAGRSMGMAGHYDMVLHAFDPNGQLRQGFPLLRDGDGGESYHELVGSMVIDDQAAVWLVGGSNHPTHNLDLVVWKFQ